VVSRGRRVLWIKSGAGAVVDFLVVSLAWRGKGQPHKRKHASHQSSKARQELGLGSFSTPKVTADDDDDTPIINPPTMALARPLPPLWQTLLPVINPNGPVRPVLNLPLLQRLSQPFRMLPTPFAALAIPSLSLPTLPTLGDIWEGILRAVPKKKTSYMKKRQRFMAGKALKEVTSLNRCSACGRVKRAHILCPYCVDGRQFCNAQKRPSDLTCDVAIKTNIFGDLWWSVRKPTEKQAKQVERERLQESQRTRMAKPDPRKETPIIKHSDWKKR